MLPFYEGTSVSGADVDTLPREILDRYISEFRDAVAESKKEEVLKLEKEKKSLFEQHKSDQAGVMGSPSPGAGGAAGTAPGGGAGGSTSPSGAARPTAFELEQQAEDEKDDFERFRDEMKAILDDEAAVGGGE